VSGRRLPQGGLVDRAGPVTFGFDGREYEGLEGDTLASALLANGVVGGFRSPILGRPRGVMSAGPEESNAFVEITEPWFDAIAPATMVRLVEGLTARPVAGVGRLPDAAPEPPRSVHRHVHVDTLVIGGGLSGIGRAWSAAGAGERVMLVDERAAFGGTSMGLDDEVNMGGPSVREYVDRALGDLRASPDAIVLSEAAALGIYDAGYVLIHERSQPVERLWHVRTQRVVLATGALERPIAFADNDRPGVMLSGAIHHYVDRFAVVPGERAVILSANNRGWAAAVALAGADVPVTLVDPLRPADSTPGPDGVDVLAGWTVVGTMGEARLEAVVVSDGTNLRTLPADLLGVCGGWNPSLQLYRAIGGTLRWDETHSAFLPGGGAPAWLEVVGRAGGSSWSPMTAPGPPLLFVPGDDLSRHFVDLQRDQTVADVAAAVDAGLRSVEHVKRATYIGTAVDQGRTSGALTSEIVNHLLGSDPGAQGPSNPRPPWTPVPFHVVAGPYRGPLFDPVRVTPIHAWHAAHGARFENVGQWRRPWFYPRDGEDLDAAVARECLAVRTACGIQDASTLGKIAVVGPGAAVFLDRMYSNAMSTLKPGRIRYGFMLGMDGMVFDDGVAMREAEDRYLITTTTGGAARVLDHLEEWLQTEWPDLRVYLTSVTEQWATAAVAGPRAREVLRAAGTDVDVSQDAFPFMAFRDGTVAGVPARLARISFSGELAFEVWTSGTDGLRVWEALTEAGAAFGLTPYGTETMHVLRAEKGYVIVGQDTDGTVTPYDLGMAWIVSESKSDFVGRRSLRRADLQRPDRKHLVGLLPNDPDELLPEGVQLVVEPRGAPPVPMVGYVTSSYRSAALERTFALAMMKGGSERHGETVFAPIGDRPVAATVTVPIFYDPEGAKRDG
jgi:sarcosine oxidase, subunit alpha